MKKGLLSLLLTSLLFVFGLQSVSAAGVNCSDFSTWNEAQTYFEQNGGSPTNNVEGLDREGDGLACEGLPGAPDKATWSFDTDRLLPGTTGNAGTGGAGGATGGTLPNTATNNVTGIIVGAITIMAGFLFLFRRKRIN
ncbi:excalibur calcium-binding domain-containing protein [Neobacillus niacini]|uniref:excalibur calcium-binding domain-containing protein n=1 Tax=Neobacillus niacini TaxID=86668 RepID=UPI0039837585